jgi:two-component system LytT family sensor kinase
VEGREHVKTNISMPRAGLVRWLPVILFWTIQVVLTATVTVAGGQMLTRGQSIQRSIVSWTVWAILAPLIVFIDRRLPMPKDALFTRVLVHLPLSLVFTTLNLYADFTTTALLNGRFQDLPVSSELIAAWFTGPLQGRFIYYWVILLVYSTFDYATNLKEEEVRTSELERLVSESRLATLRARLHPHFLFNALNTISAYIEGTPRTARTMLEQLGELLRLSLLYAEDPEIPLAQEIAFIERYLYLQSARYEGRLMTTVNMDSDTTHALIPTFILQPLVENAIRHGAAPRSRKSTVEVRAWRDQGRLHLRVRDNGPGLPAGWDPERTVGIGLSNTRERLRRVYGDKGQTFILTSENGEGVSVDIDIPFREANGRSLEK